MSDGPYGEDLAAVHAAGFTAWARAAAGELLDRLPAAAHVVELGCGDGTTARALTDAGHTVHGLDLSAAMVARARERVPEGSFEIGTWVGRELPRCDAVLAVGEVLGYALDPAAADDGALEAALAAAARALRPGGLLLLDLAGPGRVPGGQVRSWAEGEGWAVLVDAREAGERVERRITTFRDADGRGRFRRGEERHVLRLHAPADVLRVLRTHGFAARTLRPGYAGEPLAPGVTAYLARRRAQPKRQP